MAKTDGHKTDLIIKAIKIALYQCWNEENEESCSFLTTEAWHEWLGLHNVVIIYCLKNILKENFNLLHNRC